MRTDFSYADTFAIDRAATGGVAGDLRAFAARVWRDAPDYQRFVYSVSLAIILAGIIHAGIWAVLGGSWTETISWRKPTLFFLSSGVTVFISTYITNFLKLTRRRGWQLGLAALTPASVVGALISLQQFRGTRSHFNFFQSPFDAAVAGTIAFIISLFIPALAILGVLMFTGTGQDADSERWAAAVERPSLRPSDAVLARAAQAAVEENPEVAA